MGISIDTNHEDCIVMNNDDTFLHSLSNALIATNNTYTTIPIPHRPTYITNIPKMWHTTPSPIILYKRLIHITKEMET